MRRGQEIDYLCNDLLAGLEIALYFDKIAVAKAGLDPG